MQQSSDWLGRSSLKWVSSRAGCCWCTSQCISRSVTSYEI